MLVGIMRAPLECEAVEVAAAAAVAVAVAVAEAVGVAELAVKVTPCEKRQKEVVLATQNAILRLH